MGFLTRKVIIDAAAIDPALAKRLQFTFTNKKVETSAGEVLPKTSFAVKTGDDTTAFVLLPVKASGSIKYSCAIEKGTNNIGRADFYLDAGADINLSDLWTGGTPPTDTLKDYIDEKLADFDSAGAGGGLSQAEGDARYYRQTANLATQAALNNVGAAVAGLEAQTNDIDDEITFIESDINTLESSLAGKVPTSRTINSKPLTADIVITPDDLNQSADYRFVTDAEKTTWNAKQSALGFTPENAANKATSFSLVNNSLYPTVQAAKTYVDDRFTTLLGTAPANLDTLQEIAAKLADEDSVTAAIVATVAEKAAKSANLSDLTDTVAARANLGLNTTVNQTDSPNKRFATDAQIAAIAQIAAKVPTSRTITVNDVTHDLSADISFTLATPSGVSPANPEISGGLTINCATSPADNSAFIIENIPDPSNAATTALRIYPKDSANHRLYFGTSDRQIFSLNLTNVLTIENMAKFTTPDQLSVGANSFAATNIGRVGSSMQFHNADGGTTGDFVWTTAASYAGYSDGTERMRLKNDGTLVLKGKTISFGAADSGGAGKRLVYIEN